MARVRSSVRIVLDVWKALFLREALFRLFLSRGAWAWLVAEPVIHFGFLMGLRSFIMHSVVGGVDGGVYLLTGILGFFMARNVATLGMEAVNANKALFTYRQVRPVDTVLVRCALEGALHFFNTVFLFAGAGLFRLPVLPDDFLTVIAALLGLWLLGVGLGLTFSVLSEISAEVGKVIRILLYPLYFISGVMFSINSLPVAMREVLKYNPFLHGVELMRAGYFHTYAMDNFISFGYLYIFALVTIFLGLALHVRYAKRLAAP